MIIPSFPYVYPFQEELSRSVYSTSLTFLLTLLWLFSKYNIKWAVTSITLKSTINPMQANILRFESKIGARNKYPTTQAKTNINLY